MNNQSRKAVFSILMICCFLSIYSGAFAQGVVKKDSILWSYEISSSSFFSNDGVKRLLVNNNGRLKMASSAFQNRLVLNYQFGKVDSKWQENDFLAYNAFKLLPESKVFPVLINGIETSRTRDIDFRYFIGLGGGIEVIEKDFMSIEFTLTGWYEKTNYRGIDFNQDELDGSWVRHVWRLSPRILGRLNLKENHLLFEFEGWIQPSIVDFEDYLGFVNTSLLIQTVKNLYFKLGWLATYESFVLEGRNQWDSIINLGITFKKTQKRKNHQLFKPK